MALQCYQASKLASIRLVLLDQCGRIVVGPASQLAGVDFRQLAVTSNYDSNDDEVVQSVGGGNCQVNPGCAELLSLGIALQHCQMSDPLEVITGLARTLVSEGEIIGTAANAGVVCGSAALELQWKPSSGCDDAGDVPWTLYPLVQKFTRTDSGEVNGRTSQFTSLTGVAYPNVDLFGGTATGEFVDRWSAAHALYPNSAEYKIFAPAAAINTGCALAPITAT